MSGHTDRVIQMRDGQVARIVSDSVEIAAIAGSGTLEPPTMPSFPAPQPVLALA
jgi:hypothetical protein